MEKMEKEDEEMKREDEKQQMHLKCGRLEDLMS
jgi:hypothetical protein